MVERLSPTPRAVSSAVLAVAAAEMLVEEVLQQTDFGGALFTDLHSGGSSTAPKLSITARLTRRRATG
jgi:hypothetical protein